MTIVEEGLKKANLDAKEYARGPAGKNPFVISIQEMKDRPGLFRTWTGIADIDVHPDRSLHQAVITAVEKERSVTRNVHIEHAASGDQPEPDQTEGVNNRARARFMLAMPTGTTWKYGEMEARRVHNRWGNGSRWDAIIPVTATAPATSQSLLVGMDETHYFVSALPEVVTSVADAHEILRPHLAKKSGTVRQGEWFFIPVTNKKLIEALYKKLASGFTRQLEHLSSHEAFIVEHGDTLYAIGIVTDNRIGRHSPLVLTGFHRVLRNAEVQPLTTVPKRQYWD